MLMNNLWWVLCVFFTSCSIGVVPVDFDISPNINNTIVSYAVLFHVHINLHPVFDTKELKFLQVCVSYEDKHVCNTVDKLVLTYMIGLSHAENITEILITLCSNSIPGTIIVEVNPKCATNYIQRRYMYLQSPIVESKSPMPSLLLMSDGAYWERPVGILIGGDVNDIRVIIQLTTDVRIYISTSVLPMCRHFISAYSVECCALETEDSSCDPPVADFALLILEQSSSRISSGRLIDLLSVVNGRLLIASRDMNQTQLVAALPEPLTSRFQFKSVDLTQYLLLFNYTALLLVDLAEGWFARVLQTPLEANGQVRVEMRSLVDIPPSTARFSRRYGFNTATLQHVCLYNHTSLLLFKKFHYSSGSAEDVLSSDDRLMLSDPSSGFYPSSMADGTEGGGGWKFVELTNDYKRDCELTGDCPQVVWLPGVHMLTTPAYSNSIIHLAQTLLIVVHASYHPAHYPWICHVLRATSFTLLPTLTRQEHQWSLSLISQLRAFLRQQRREKTGWMAKECPQLLGRDWERQEEGSSGGLPAIALAEDIDAMLMRQQTDSHRYTHSKYHSQLSSDRTSPPVALCMEETVLLGSTELTSPFLSSAQEASAFREFAYNYLNTSVPMINESHLTPNDALRITLISRSENRWITNTPALLHVIEAMGVADVAWLRARSGGGGVSGGRFLETMSVRAQVQLMQQTDILVATHGAGLMNMIYLREHSAVVEILTSPWYEPAYQCTALATGLSYYVLPQTDINRSTHCVFPKECMDLSLTQRSRLACFGMRQCSVRVDVQAFEVLMWQAVQAVRILKRRLHEARSADFGAITNNERYGCRASDASTDDCVATWERARAIGHEYRKPLKHKLSPLQP